MSKEPKQLISAVWSFFAQARHGVRVLRPISESNPKIIPKQVPQQVGNTCGEHAVVNAVKSVGGNAQFPSEPRNNMSEEDIQTTLALYPEQYKIFVIGSILLFDEWKIESDLFFKAAGTLQSSDICLIINTAENADNPDSIAHWISIFFPQNQSEPIEVMDSLNLSERLPSYRNAAQLFAAVASSVASESSSSSSSSSLSTSTSTSSATSGNE